MVIPLLLLLTVAPSKPTEARRHLDVATQRFKAMDLQAALDELAKARKVSNRAEDDLQVALLTGVVKAYLGREDEAKDAFRGALALEHNAKLPVSVSPKVQALFADARKPEEARRKADVPMPPPPDTTPKSPPPSDKPLIADRPAAPPPVADVAPLAPPPPAKEKPRLVVLEFAPAGGVPPEVAGVLTETATAEVAGRGFFDVMGAKEVQTLLGVERQKALLGAGCEGQECLNQLSGLLGAGFVMSGTVAKLGTAYQLNLQVLDTRKSQPLGRSTRIAKDLESLRAQIPYAVAEACGTPLPPPPSRVVPYSLIAGGVAVVAGAVIVGFDGLSQERVVNSEFGASASNPAVLKTYQQYQSQSSTISAEKTASLVALGAGAALVALGVYLSPPDVVSGAGVHLSLAPTPGGGAFAVSGVIP